MIKYSPKQVKMILDNLDIFNYNPSQGSDNLERITEERKRVYSPREIENILEKVVF